jgi:ribosome-binding factor A
MVSKLRAQRIADRIFEELSMLLLMEVSDPRLETVSITNVAVDRELAFATIYVSSIEGSDAAQEIIEGLNHASGYLQRIQLRSFPKLRFHWDFTPERADHIDKLLNSLPDYDYPNSQDEENSQDNG